MAKSAVNALLPDTQLLVVAVSPAYGVTLQRTRHQITVSPDVAGVVWGTAGDGQ